MNKEETQLTEQKGKVTHLLEAGHHQAARVLVEDVIKIEKTMEACELLGIYCERIIERMPFIESQKECPSELKEAVASVIFASSRCADIPEFKAVKKHLSAKYGKDFTSSALELRPDCGVSLLLVQKLSLRAPDGPTKIRRLKAIAEERNVKWDPESFEDNYSEAPSDLLNGPSSFQGASYIPEQLPPTQKSLNYRSYFQAPARKVSPNSNSYGLDSTSQAYLFNIGGVEKVAFKYSDQRAASPPSSSREDLSVPGNSSSSHVEISLRDNSISRPSHVHPKLPDYDPFEAYFLALRQDNINRASHAHPKPAD